MFVWVVRGKLDSGIGTCRFPVNTYVNIIVVSVYSNVQVIYYIVFSVDILNWRFWSILLISSKIVCSFVLF